jgi:hypothetical protein
VYRRGDPLPHEELGFRCSEAVAAEVARDYRPHNALVDHGASPVASRLATELGYR